MTERLDIALIGHYVCCVKAMCRQCVALVFLFLYFTFLSHLFPLLELVVQFPARCSAQVLLCLFPGVLQL